MVFYTTQEANNKYADQTGSMNKMICSFVVHIFRPPHDKTNKMVCAPSEDSDQPGHPPSLISLRCPHEESLDP